MTKISLLSPYLLAATATIMSLWLFILVKVDIRRAARKRAEDRKEILEACRKIQETIDEMRRHAPAPIAQPEPLPPGSASTMSRRAQVLRLARRGDRADQIAAALGMPLNEVALVLKVASLQQASAASA